jgi:hypothetical protein
VQQLIERRNLMQAVRVFDGRVDSSSSRQLREATRAREVAIAEPQCLRADQQGASTAPPTTIGVHET